LKIIYFDCFAGVSGDMILGALVDAGLDIELLKNELSKLKIDGFRISSEKAVKNGITGTRMLIETDEQKAHRHLRHIVEIIDDSNLDDEIKTKSKNIFTRLAEAEAKIHNTTPEKIHFHEVGALDAIIDIVGSVIGLRLLGIEKIFASRIHVGTGFVDCQHGRIPLPAPATVELLKGIPVYSTGIESELTTPTGAAILSTLADSFGTIPDMNVQSSGYGAGNADLQIPNLLRVVIGEQDDSRYETDKIAVVETNIDDMNPEFFEYIIERLMHYGALDAYLTPIYMKKNRPATLMTVLIPADNLNPVLDIIFSETTTIGVRIHHAERKKLRRESITVNTPLGEIRVKAGWIGDRLVNLSPEYDDCRKIAQEKNIPLKDVFEEAKAAAKKQINNQS